MAHSQAEDTRTYVVLVNHEEQYSLWLHGKEIPHGWREARGPGSKEECLAYVREVWTDMTPLSLRNLVPSTGETRQVGYESEGSATATVTLPSILADGTQHVMYQSRRDDGLDELKEAVDRKYVHVKFTQTRGGTELGFPLDEERSDLSHADWENGLGTIHLEGKLKLDGVPMWCMVDLDLSTLEGRGRVELL